MIYYPLLFLLKLAIGSFFRKIEITGKENLPKKGSAVFVVNHPNALIDPLLVTIIAGRQLHYIAGAEFFGNKLTSWFLRKQCNMVPVYRPNIYKGESVNNDHMFEHCYKALANNGVINIFSEGTSEIERRVNSLKSGTARMVLGAEKQINKKIPIIPIGLNYAESFRFRSDVLISIGESFTLDDIEETDEREIVKVHTLRVWEKLKQQVIHIEDETLTTTIERLEYVFSNQLHDGKSIDSTESLLKKKFKLTKELIKAIEHFNAKSPALILSIQDQLEDYYQKIQEIPMRGKLMNYVNTNNSFLELLGLTFLFPLFLLGLAINAIPFYLAIAVFRKKYYARITDTTNPNKIKLSFGRTVAFSVGSLLFVAWYIMLGIIYFNMFPWWWGLMLLAISYGLGLMSLRYISFFRTVKDRFACRRILRKYPNEIEALIQLRGKIIEEVKGLIEKVKNC